MEKENKKITQEEIKAIEEKAKKIRKGIIEEVYSHQSGHPGGSLSVADIMSVHPKSVTADTKITQIEKILQDNKIHSVLVTDEDNHLLGIVDSFSTML